MTAIPIRTEPDRYPAIGISQGFRVGDVVYISGQVGTDDAGAIVGPDFTSQAHQVFRNQDRALRAGGSDLAHVFKVTVYVTNVADHFETIVALRLEHGEPGLSRSPAHRTNPCRPPQEERFATNDESHHGGGRGPVLSTRGRYRTDCGSTGA